MNKKFKDERHDQLKRKEKGLKIKDNRQTLKSQVCNLSAEGWSREKISGELAALEKKEMCAISVQRKDKKKNFH